MTSEKFTKLLHKTFNRAKKLLFEDPALKEVSLGVILRSLSPDCIDKDAALRIANLIILKASLLRKPIATAFFEQKEQSIIVLCRKAKEYADNEDRLYNFKRAAEIAEMTPAQVCYGMMLKHIVSVEDLATGRIPVTQELADEKFGDLINYLLLLKGCKNAETKQMH